MLKLNLKLLLLILISGLITFITTPIPTAKAGVFDLPTFLEPGRWSVGIEPEIIISSPAGAGFNFKPRYGINSFFNLEGIIGTGSGSHEFRAGGIAGFDWFPDVGSQPGIGTPIVMQYRKIEGSGSFSYGFSPLIYKTFETEKVDFIPFVSVPFGWTAYKSNNKGFVQVAFGTMFNMPSSENVRFTIESGFNAVNSFSYISGGFTYYP